ncbi:hypothetical protein EV127DRAFT_496671 [Xylaria flabelliformis]|nr:hypothetical protein EV127DRAFT_496671 [Xylaria flabelliformis]
MGGVASISTDHSRKVQVISAGYSRTGTVSMSLALDKLFDGPILHGGTQILTRDDVRKATTGFVGTADLPPADFVSEMVELYPDAKVVLVKRDATRWWNSIAALTSRTTPLWLGVFLAPIPEILEPQQEKVRSLVPKDQLLEMDLNDGWEPLCKFLKIIPVPNEPFPRANDAKAADQYATKVLLKVLLVWTSLLAGVGALAYFGVLQWGCRKFRVIDIGV